MEPIRLDDILGRERYESRREAVRQRVIAHKRARRVALGDRLSLVFEDRATVWYQIQEMCWVEHITELDAVREEVAVYNASLPEDGELAATLFIEVADQAHVAAELDRLIGIDEHVRLEIGDLLRVTARFEPGRQTAEKLSAVQYVRFPITAEARAAALGGAPLALGVDHPNYRARAALPEPVRASLVAELAGGGGETLQRVRDGD